MTRFTAGNIFKAALAFFFFIFVAFLVLIIGIGAKSKKIIFEGAIYSAVFIVGLSIPEDNVLATLGASLGLLAMIVSAVRSYMLRDFWLRKKVRRPQYGQPVQASMNEAFPTQPPPVAPVQAQPSDELSTALTWVSAHAKQNKHRLPSDTYVTILETCQTLDAIIDAEARQPSADARFEYELEALVREYLPAVLQGYLAIPPSMVENQQPNGRTPNEELVEQLGLILGQAEALHSNRHRQTSAELTSTGNFLRERFGHHQKGRFDFGIK